MVHDGFEGVSAVELAGSSILWFCPELLVEFGNFCGMVICCVGSSILWFCSELVVVQDDFSGIVCVKCTGTFNLNLCPELWMEHKELYEKASVVSVGSSVL